MNFLPRNTTCGRRDALRHRCLVAGILHGSDKRLVGDLGRSLDHGVLVRKRDLDRAHARDALEGLGHVGNAVLAHHALDVKLLLHSCAPLVGGCLRGSRILDLGRGYGIVLRAKGMLPTPDGEWLHFDYVPEEEEVQEVPEKPKDKDLTYQQVAKMDILINVSVILICMGLGVWLAQGVGALLKMTFPSYVCAMFVGVLVRNFNERFHYYRFCESLVGSFGEIMLNLYLAIVLMSLKLWEMAGILSGVMLIVLAHVVFILLLCYFVVFPVLGRNYDAAVMCAGLCGHGLGAVPSAMVNMTVLADQYGMSRKAFLIVPVVGSCLADLAYQPHTLLLIKLFVENVN